ncbi:MAG: hypothetical protein ACXW18_05750 [Pyrinomonadaceae bacterium]
MTRIRTLCLVIATALLSTACGGAGLSTSASKLDVKVGGKDSTLEVKSSTAGYSTFAVTSPGGQSIRVTLQTIYLANHEMDANPSSWNKPLTEPGQMRVALTLMNGDGPDENFKVGTYNAQSESANGVYDVAINIFADGKQTGTRFYGSYMGSAKRDIKPTGEVKITNVTADTVSGEVNLTEGDTSIKGTFTAKLPKK